MKKIGLMAVAVLLAACSGTSSQQENEAGKEGLMGKVHKVQTLIYKAKLQGTEIAKDDKPDPYGEMDFFPKEDTRIYNEEGRLDSIVSVLDVTKYITVYTYQEGKVSNEKLFRNGELLTDRNYVYQGDNLAKTVEDMYVGGDKTTNEYPVDASKVEYVDGNRVEHGETERDYVVKDAQGRILKESAYNEMDEYQIIKEYTYNDKGWLTSCTMGEDTKFSYEYPETDNRATGRVW
ncbi:MAG: hypothetical protein LUE99_03935 [Bacteroides sp.]|nr:hypothetical protein [Bacteroides sp.]